MENEEIKIEELVRPKRRVSLFRRRKKASTRPLVQEKKKREYKKIVFVFLLFIVFLFSVSALLYLIRFYIISPLLIRNQKIISPQGTVYADNKDVENALQDKRIDFSNLQFASESAIVTFTLNKRTVVTITKLKDVKIQLDLVEAINRQITSSGKQAISIDLRYNKPIVKY